MQVRPLPARRMADLRVFEADLADPGQAAIVVRLLDAYARDEMGGGRPLSAYAKANLVPELRKRPGACVILAELGAETVGLMICLEGFSTFACRPLLNIHDVVVLGSFRGRGIAKRMLAQAEAVARRRGCCKLTLEVLDGNAPAVGLYRAFGFQGYALDPAKGEARFWQKLLD